MLAALPPNGLLLLTAVAVVGLVLLIARFKCNAFIAILLASIFVGAGSGMSLGAIATTIEAGIGSTLGKLGMIIGLGAVLGKLLAESGAAEVIATRMVRLMGVKRLDYAMMLIAFLIGISVFFNVGIILLGPIAFSLARETRTPILRLALPMAAGFSVAHGLIPPHPGPMAAIGTVGANVGKTIWWSVILGLPVALITGPLLTHWVAPRVPVEIGGLGALATSGGGAPRPPGFAISIFTMLLPVLLMLVGTVADLALPQELKLLEESLKANGTPLAPEMARSPAMLALQASHFIGAPTVAMLLAVLVSFWTFGRNCGLTGDQILRFTGESAAPIASILLVIGAGGGFSKILQASNVGAAIAGIVGDKPLSSGWLLVMGWTVAGLLRVATGSATVSIQTASTLMLPLIVIPGAHVNRELLVLSMGAGSLILSHVNDSGFWFIREYFGLSISQTLRTWTVVETGIAVVSIALILFANLFVG